MLLGQEKMPDKGKERDSFLPFTPLFFSSLCVLEPQGDKSEQYVMMAK